jgi:hypothetical protein
MRSSSLTAGVEWEGRGRWAIEVQVGGEYVWASQYVLQWQTAAKQQGYGSGQPPLNSPPPPQPLPTSAALTPVDLDAGGVLHGEHRGRGIFPQHLRHLDPGGPLKILPADRQMAWGGGQAKKAGAGAAGGQRVWRRRVDAARSTQLSTHTHPPTHPPNHPPPARPPTPTHPPTHPPHLKRSALAPSSL